MRLPSLTVLIPAYNDQATIAAVVNDAVRSAGKTARHFSVLVCNDASHDNTAVVLQQLAPKVPELRIMTHTENRGYGGTIRDLYLAGDGEWLFTVPGDGQIAPSVMETLALKAGTADMVIGWRKERSDNPKRKLQSRIYNGLLRGLFGIRIRDINSVRLMKKETVTRLASPSAFVDAELTIRAIRAGKKVVEVPIAHRSREAGVGGGGRLSTILPVIRDMIFFRLFPS